MAADESSGKPAGPVVLRIKLRYDDVDAMVQRFAPNVGKSGLFLPTKSIQPVGTEVKFELRIANDTAVLVGLGKVRAVRPPDPANPKAAFGMAIELMRVTREGRDVIMRMLERRRAMGLPDVAIPMPEDVDTARRPDVETQPKAEVPRPPEPKLEPRPSTRESQLLTAPRPGSGPIAGAKAEPSRPAAPALAPEPAKAKRPRVTELIARATESSGALAAVAVPGLDEHVDVERALVRARALAGGDLDTELALLRESAAAPIEISIEAASAELARQLGGAAIVKRDRNARWAPPPVVDTTGDASASGAISPTAAPASESVSAFASGSVSDSASVSESASEPRRRSRCCVRFSGSLGLRRHRDLRYARRGIAPGIPPSRDLECRDGSARCRAGDRDRSARGRGDHRGRTRARDGLAPRRRAAPRTRRVARATAGRADR